jgi:hypothetical protein
MVGNMFDDESGNRFFLRLVIGGILIIITAIISPIIYENFFGDPKTPFFESMGIETDVDGNYEINWQKTEKTDYYLLQEDKNLSFTNPRIIYKGSETKADIHEKSNGDYYYRIRACNKAGESDWSSPLKVTVLAQTTPPPPPSNNYMVYSDMGIAAGDVWIWSGADWGLESPLLEDGNFVAADAPEGTTCFAVSSGSGQGNYVGWGVFLGIFENHELIKPHTVDLSDYENLEFWVKTSVDLKVEIQQDNSEGKKSVPFFISNYGWNSGSPDVWQKVTIPKSEFRNADLTKIFCPFMITGMGSEITFYVDEVMWVP